MFPTPTTTELSIKKLLTLTRFLLIDEKDSLQRTLHQAARGQVYAATNVFRDTSMEVHAPKSRGRLTSSLNHQKRDPNDRVGMELQILVLS